MWYLPHQQASHNEGVKDGEEAINRRWIKAGQKRKKMGQLIQKSLSLLKNVSKNFTAQRKNPAADTHWTATPACISPKPNYNQDHSDRFPRNAKKKK